MNPFTVHRGKVAVLDWTDVNTDLIIPARYLKRIERVGYGSLLFADKRYVAGGAPAIDEPEKHGALDPAFPLNRPENQGASVLLVGKNFGCGSSREHAVWAVAQGGFAVVIAPGKDEGFADIFEGNALNNGLLAVEIPQADWDRINEVAGPGGAEAVVDLENLLITVTKGSAKVEVPFVIPETRRERLLKGLDAISETLLLEAEIARYEQSSPAWLKPASA
ncbi:3-isopropylmalate dehydratase small subunit [Paludisphaera sp.]|uniref:3-isopropylmalate dehydratase small subunit n=1 Tax=Paludisphaera sp. TaxID=2017432 RepID=UPI00301DA2BB